ncbi:unnamed protein product [Rotaria magnacalcarata]
MNLKLPRLIEKPVPSPVAKSEAVAHIQVDVDTKEQRHGDNGPILIVDSAGAQSTALYYGTSGMQSFFQAAIIQSSPMSLPFRTYTEYITRTVLLAEQLKCAVSDIVCFRKVSYQDIIAAQLVVTDMITSLNVLFFFEPWVPVIDNIIVQDQLVKMISNTSFTLKPLIIGTVTDESLSFLYGLFRRPVSVFEYAEILFGLFGNNFFKVVEHFPPDEVNDQRPLLACLFTQWTFTCSSRLFARKAPIAYTYVFTYPPITNGASNSSVFQWHVCHGDELYFLFEALWANLTDAGRRLSTDFANYWTNYAKSQDPNQLLQVPLI